MPEADKGENPQGGAEHAPPDNGAPSRAAEDAIPQHAEKNDIDESEQEKRAGGGAPQKRRPILDSQWIMALATVGILVANIVYAVFANKQLGAINDQSKDIRTQASAAAQAARAASSAANTAQQTLAEQKHEFSTESRSSNQQFLAQLQKINANLTEQNRLATASEGNLAVSRKALMLNQAQFAVEQRPWVDLRYTSSGIGGSISIQNYGRSPAIVRVATMIQVYAVGDPFSGEMRPDNTFSIFQRIKRSIFRSEITLPPGGRDSVQINRPENAIMLAHARNDLYAWVLVGETAYNDYFGHKYRSDFCVFSDPTTNGAGDTAGATFCPTHNQ